VVQRIDRSNHLFDHFISEGEQRRRNVDAERLAVLRLMTNSNLVGACIGRRSRRHEGSLSFNLDDHPSVRFAVNLEFDLFVLLGTEKRRARRVLCRDCPRSGSCLLLVV